MNPEPVCLNGSKDVWLCMTALVCVNEEFKQKMSGALVIGTK